MIERKFVAQKHKEYQIQEYVNQTLDKVGHSHTKMKKTPLGEKIIIHASRPGLIVGKKGGNIKTLTKVLKKKFDLENPQIEIVEVENVNTDARIVAEKIATSLERFGSQRFKGIMHKALEDTMKSGAMGIEILLSGKVPSSRAKTWRVITGYLKKSGDVAVEGVRKAYATAKLKTGIIGIQVRIMPADIRLPDDVRFIGEDNSKKVVKSFDSTITKAEMETEEDIPVEKLAEVEDVSDEFLSEKIKDDADVDDLSDEE